jgi:hypothetical protein
MDPNNGRIYPSLEAARAAGVPNPVEITGLREDVEKISRDVAEAHTRRVSAAEKAQRRAKNKRAKAARKASR